MERKLGTGIKNYFVRDRSEFCKLIRWFRTITQTVSAGADPLLQPARDLHSEILVLI